MKQSILLKLLPCLVLLPLVCMTLLAQDANAPGVIVTQGDPTWVHVVRPPTIVTPAVIPDVSKLYTIYSNLGSKTDAYDDTNGVYVNGPDAGQGNLQWIAAPFRPKQDAVVTKIEVPLEYGGAGTNAVTISLNEDRNNLPGKVIYTWNLANLPAWPSCCTLDVARDTKGLKVNKSVPYWVVAKTNAKTTTTLDVWPCVNNGNRGYVSFNQGGGWIPAEFYFPAFAVFGKKAN